MVDEEGLVHILDRIKGLVKVKGIGVAAAAVEIEDCLPGYEKVEDVAVMGIIDEWAEGETEGFCGAEAGRFWDSGG